MRKLAHLQDHRRYGHTWTLCSLPRPMNHPMSFSQSSNLNVKLNIKHMVLVPSAALTLSITRDQHTVIGIRRLGAAHCKHKGLRKSIWKGGLKIKWFFKTQRYSNTDTWESASFVCLQFRSPDIHKKCPDRSAESRRQHWLKWPRGHTYQQLLSAPSRLWLNDNFVSF